MNIKQAMAKFLKDSDTIRDLTGGRIFPQRANQGVKLPYVVIRRLGGTPFNDLAGEPACTVTILDIAAHAESDNQVEDITEAIRNRLSSYRGPMGELQCHTCSLESSPRDIARPPRDGSDSWRFSSSAAYRITHSQPLVTHT